MILVTLGTQKEQFTRLLDYIENSDIKDEIIVQAGYTKYESKKMKIFDFIPYEKMSEYISKSDLVITHSGTGSVLMPLKEGKKVIVCARLEKYGEHVDDHQKQLADVFSEEGYVLELDENISLDELVKKSKKFNPKKYESNTKQFINKLTNEINNTTSSNNTKPINIFKKIYKNKILVNTLIIFFTFLLVSFFVPLTGDDWTNANFNTNNIFDIVKIAYGKYFEHEGRFMSRIFVVFLTNTKLLWNILNAIMIATVYNISVKLIKPKNITFVSLIYVFSMLFIENTVFTQSFLWVTGNMTYFLPMFLVLIYIYIVRGVFDNKFKFSKLVIIISIILNILIPTMVEHIGVSIVCINLLFLLYSFIKERKINKLFLINFIISTIGFLIIYLSPGAAIRAQETEFYNYTLFQKIQTNIPNFINYTYIKNAMLLILILSLIILFINKHVKGIKKLPLIILISIVPLLTIMSHVFSLISNYSSRANNILNRITFIIDSGNIFIILFWIFISLLLTFINLVHIKNTNNYRAAFFFIIGMLANLSLLLSPISGGRTSLFTIVMLSINVLILIEDYNLNINKFINSLLYIIFLVYMVILLVLYSSVYRQQKIRQRMILEQIDSGDKVIKVERFPENILWNSNAWNEFHEYQFKKYYGIDTNIAIERIRVEYKYQLLYRR